MIEKRTALDQIEISRAGQIGLRFALLIVDGGAIIHRQWHRTAIPFGGEVEAQFAAVDANLAELGWPIVEPGAVGRVRAVADAFAPLGEI